MAGVDPRSHPNEPETIVFETNGRPLIVRAERPAALDEELVGNARNELLARGPQRNSFAGGWLLGVEETESFPAAQALAKTLREGLIREEEERWGVPFAFSFLKTHTGTPPRDATEGWYFEGPHIDSHPELIGSVELLRVLVNLAPVPRRFVYLDVDRFTLEARGLTVTKDTFTQLQPTTGSEPKEIVLGGRKKESVHLLRFWASVVPHVGINDSEGSFLASFEAPADFSTTRIWERKTREVSSR